MLIKCVASSVVKGTKRSNSENVMTYLITYNQESIFVLNMLLYHNTDIKTFPELDSIKIKVIKLAYRIRKNK